MSGADARGREWPWALVAGGIPLFIYTLTLAPTLTLEDSGEFIAGAHVLGVLHPTGYPLWTMVAHAFTWLPFGSIAERVHFSSAFFGAGMCLMAFLCMRRMGAGRLAAVAMAVALGGSRILWSQSIVAEVYALNGFLVMLATWLVLRWRDQKSPRDLVFLALTVGLGMGNHHIMGMMAAVLFAWILWEDWKAVVAPRTVAGGAVAFLAGLSTHAYIVLRARQNPPLNFLKPDSFSKLLDHVQRSAYAAETDRFTGGTEDTLTHIGHALLDGAAAVTWPITLIALFGLGVGVRNAGQRRAICAIAGLFVFNAIILNFIMTAPSTPLWIFVHRVYYVPAHGALLLLAAYGLETTFGIVQRRGVPSIGLAVAAVVLAGFPWLMNREHAAYQSDPIAANYIEDFLAGAPEGAGYFPLNDTVVFSLLFTEFVEGRREDVDILREDMGWDGSPPSIIIHDQPVTRLSAEKIKSVTGNDLTPAKTLRGLTWLRSSEADRDWGYVELDRPLHAPPGPPPEYNPFAELVRSQYTIHHAMRGLKLQRDGRSEEALAAFDVAEKIDPREPFAQYMIAYAYQEAGVRTERVVPRYRRALEDFDTYFDKAGHGLSLPIDRSEIRSRLAVAEIEYGQ